jgi:hypothetical protein
MEKGDPTPEGLLASAYFRKIGGRTIRIDILERVDEAFADAMGKSADAEDAVNVIVSLLGCAREDVAKLAAALGWKRETRAVEGSEPPVTKSVWTIVQTGKHRPRRKKPARKPVQPDSPFAQLAHLIPAD